MDIYGGLLHCRNIKGPFYRRYSIVIEIRCIFRFCPRWMLVNWPLQNLVHGTTAVQSRHEQNWTLIDTQKWNHRTTNFPLTLNFMLMGGLSVFVFDLAFLWNHSETCSLKFSQTKLLKLYSIWLCAIQFDMCKQWFAYKTKEGRYTSD